MNGQNFQALVQQILQLLNNVSPILIGLAVVYFFAGIVRYISKGGNEKEEGAAKDMIIYGLIGIFVMVSVWGLLAILTNTFMDSTGYAPQSVQDLLNPITSQQIGTGQSQPSQ